MADASKNGSSRGSLQSLEFFVRISTFGRGVKHLAAAPGGMMAESCWRGKMGVDTLSHRLPFLDMTRTMGQKPERPRFLNLGWVNRRNQIIITQAATKPRMADQEVQAETPPVADESGQEMTVATTNTEEGGQEMALATTNTDVAAPAKKVKKIIRKKRRPARVQMDPDEVPSDQPAQTGTVFNIWYNLWSGGDREDKALSKSHAKGRCNIAKDSGYTRGDSTAGSYFCVYFGKWRVMILLQGLHLTDSDSSRDVYQGSGLPTASSVAGNVRPLQPQRGLLWTRQVLRL